MKLLFPFLLALFLFACTSEPSSQQKEDAVVNQKETPTEEQPIENEAPTSRSTNSQSAKSIEAFWPAFQAAVEKKDAQKLADQTYFPLEGGQYLVGKPNLSGGISRNLFETGVNNLFDQEARQMILSKSASELEQLELEVSDLGLDKGVISPPIYRLIVNYDMEEETESSVMYIFGMTKQGIKLVKIDFAG